MNPSTWHQAPLFTSLQPEQRRKLEDMATTKRLEVEEVLFMEDDVCTGFYVLVEGALQLTRFGLTPGSHPTLAVVLPVNSFAAESRRLSRFVYGVCALMIAVCVASIANDTAAILYLKRAAAGIRVSESEGNFYDVASQSLVYAYYAVLLLSTIVFLAGGFAVEHAKVFKPQVHPVAQIKALHQQKLAAAG